MKIRDLVDIDGKNANGQRVSLLNPDKATSGVRKDGMESQRPQMRPSVIRRQAHSGYGDHEGRSHSISSSSTNHSRRTGYREHALHLERMYSTGSSSTSSTSSTSRSNSSLASSSSMLSSRYEDRTRASLTPPTPEQDEFMEDSIYDDPDSCATASPYPNFSNQHPHSFPFASPPDTLQPDFRQSNLEPSLHTRLLDLTVRGRHSSDSGLSPLMPSPPISSAHSNTILPSFNQAFSDYVISPLGTSQQSFSPFDRDSHDQSPRPAYIASHAPARLSTTSDSLYSSTAHENRRPPLRLDVQRSDIPNSSYSITSSNSMGSPQTPGASSDDSHSHSHTHSRPQAKKSLSSRSASSVLSKGPSDRHRYPCPLADEYECRSYFTTSGHASRHAKKHTGKRDAECPECHRCFTRKDNMEQHRRTHNKEGKKNKKSSSGLGAASLPTEALKDLERERSTSLSAA